MRRKTGRNQLRLVANPEADFLYTSPVLAFFFKLKYSSFKWFALEMNRDHSVIFEIASKYWSLDSLVDYDSYSISSKGILAHSSKYNGHLR